MDIALQDKNVKTTRFQKVLKFAGLASRGLMKADMIKTRYLFKSRTHRH